MSSLDHFERQRQLAERAIASHRHEGPRAWESRYRCWCCNDTGWITVQNLRQYYMVFQAIKPNAQGQTLSEAARWYDVNSVPVLCKNCAANEAPIGSLDDRATRDECRGIHDMALEAARQAANNPQPVPVPDAVKRIPKGSILAKIAQDLGMVEKEATSDVQP